MSRTTFGKKTKIWDRSSDIPHHLNDLRIDTELARPGLSRNRSSSPMLSAFGLQQPWIKVRILYRFILFSVYLCITIPFG